MKTGEREAAPPHTGRRGGSGAGSFAPGPEVGGGAGWEDPPYAISAMRRKNGESLRFVKEDWRGKNLLYRWTP